MLQYNKHSWINKICIYFVYISKGKFYFEGTGPCKGVVEPEYIRDFCSALNMDGLEILKQIVQTI